MKLNINRILGLTVSAFTLATATACDDFLEVENPNSLEAENIDPENDARLLSLSVYQAFVEDYGYILATSAWFTNEARVGDTFPTLNAYGRRDLPDNGDQSTPWNALHDNTQFARTTIRSIEGAGNSVDLARAWFVAGYSILMQAELFCQGTLAESWLVSRGPMTSAELLDSAVVHLDKARTIATAVGGTEGTALANAAQVGIARAHLQAGRKPQASAAAATVPASFVFNLSHLDDPSNRNRLGNRIWSYSESRISLVVGPEFMAMADAGDPRISYVDMKRPAQDGVLNFFRQNKITGWASPDRLASGLEARYIKVEADNNAAEMLAFINERRAVGKQTPIAGGTPDQLLRELMEQKARDFWLEGKRVGDLRRNPNHVPYILAPGDTYYKTGLGFVNNQTCWPVPDAEKRTNPFWPKTG